MRVVVLFQKPLPIKKNGAVSKLVSSTAPPVQTILFTNCCELLISILKNIPASRPKPFPVKPISVALVDA